MLENCNHIKNLIPLWFVNLYIFKMLNPINFHIINIFKLFFSQWSTSKEFLQVGRRKKKWNGKNKTLMNRKIILIPELKPGKNPGINMIFLFIRVLFFPFHFFFLLPTWINSLLVDNWVYNSFYFNINFLYINLRLNKNKNWNISTLWLDNSIRTALLFRTNNIKYKNIKTNSF